MNLISYIYDNDTNKILSIDFIKDLALLIPRDECCMSHLLLYKYVLVNAFNTYEFKENIDFIRKGSEYLMHPNMFRTYIINTEYESRYILLENIVWSYYDPIIQVFRENIQSNENAINEQKLVIEKQQTIIIEHINSLENSFDNLIAKEKTITILMKEINKLKEDVFNKEYIMVEKNSQIDEMEMWLRNVDELGSKKIGKSRCVIL